MKKLQTFCDQHPKFQFILPSKNEVVPEIQIIDTQDDELRMKKFGEELKLIQAKIKDFLDDLEDLKHLQEDQK